MRVALLVLVVVVLGAFWLIDATDMTVDKTYATLSGAQADSGGIAHGWLPDLLPTSSYDIRTINDLDHNGSQGHFRFGPSDAYQLARNFRKGAPDASKYADWDTIVAAERRKGRTLL